MYLLDTNVISELRKARSGRAEPRVVRWAERVPPVLMYLSVITVQELEAGVCRAERRDAAQGAVLRRWLEQQVLPAFAGRLLPVDVAVARRSGQLHGAQSRPASDALIAATALEHGLILVTRNVADFAPMGVKLVNPWDDQETAAG